MEMNEHCPCPNIECPNHGYCEKCNSRHVRKGYLSYCAFHTILPSLLKVMAEGQGSEAATKLDGLLAPQLAAYEALKEKFGITQDELAAKLAEVSRISDY